MLSTQERQRRKGKLSKELLQQYEELYSGFCKRGYSKSLADQFNEIFVDNAKKPAPEDIVQAARLYDKVHELKLASDCLALLEENKKMSAEEKFAYCIESLKNRSKLGNWRDAEDFRTENINFMQNHSVKADMILLAEMYMALSHVDCAARRYSAAFRLLKGFGYKPKGRNDTMLLEILIMCVYICAKSGDKGSIDNAVSNACAALKLFDNFEFSWTRNYYENRIVEAYNGIN